MGGDNLTDVLGRAIRNRMAELNTAMPAQIVSYDYRTQKAQVKPTVNRLFADGKTQAYPVINNVPVIFPRSGGASMTFPVKPGDTVLLIFASRSVDAWINQGGTVDQNDTRMHSLNDAIAIPGLIPFPTGSMAKNNEDVLIKYGEAEIEIKQDSQINMKSPIKVYIDAPLLECSNDIKAGNDIYAGNDITAKNDLYDEDREFGSYGSHRQKYNDHQHRENGVDELTDNPEDQYLWD